MERNTIFHQTTDVVAASAKKASELGITPFTRLISCSATGDDSRKTCRTSQRAVKKALEKANLTIDRMDLIETQKAFAAQILAEKVKIHVLCPAEPVEA